MKNDQNIQSFPKMIGTYNHFQMQSFLIIICQSDLNFKKMGKTGKSGYSNKQSPINRTRSSRTGNRLGPVAKAASSKSLSNDSGKIAVARKNDLSFVEKERSTAQLKTKLTKLSNEAIEEVILDLEEDLEEYRLDQKDFAKKIGMFKNFDYFFDYFFD